MVMIHFIFPKLIFLSLVKYFKAKAEPSSPVFLLKTEIVGTLYTIFVNKYVLSKTEKIKNITVILSKV